MGQILIKIEGIFSFGICIVLTILNKPFKYILINIMIYACVYMGVD